MQRENVRRMSVIGTSRKSELSQRIGAMLQEVVGQGASWQIYEFTA
jgi:hypothetical protein